MRRQWRLQPASTTAGRDTRFGVFNSDGGSTHERRDGENPWTMLPLLRDPSCCGIVLPGKQRTGKEKKGRGVKHKNKNQGATSRFIFCTVRSKRCHQKLVSTFDIIPGLRTQHWDEQHTTMESGSTSVALVLGRNLSDGRRGVQRGVAHGTLAGTLKKKTITKQWFERILTN